MEFIYHFLISSLLAGLFYAGYRVLKHRWHIAHQLALTQVAYQAQEQERQRLASELHDALGSKLQVIQFCLGHEKAGQKDNLKNMVQEVIDTSQQLAYNLYPPMLQYFGLAAVLDDLVLQLSQMYQVHYSCSLPPHPLEQYKALQLLRIVQEFTNNTIKHAQAHQLTIWLRPYQGVLLLYLADDGIGYHPPSEVAKGHGLPQINNRLRALQATHRITTQIGRGVQLIAIVP